MIYASRLIASMGNYNAARALIEANWWAENAERAHKSARYWEGRWHDKTSELQRARANIKVERGVSEDLARMVRDVVESSEGVIELYARDRDAALSDSADMLQSVDKLERELSRLLAWLLFLGVLCVVAGVSALAMLFR